MNQKQPAKGFDIFTSHALARELYGRCYSDIKEIIDSTRNNRFELNLPALIFLATNLTFACEVFLKIAVYLEKREVASGHNLKDIYLKLSPHNRKILSENFNKNVGSLPDEPNLRVIFIRTRIEYAPPSDEPSLDEVLKNRESAKDLSEFLGMVGSSYNYWRYIFQNSTEKTNHYEFHYHSLCTLCQMLDLWIFSGRDYLKLGRSTPSGDGILKHPDKKIEVMSFKI